MKLNDVKRELALYFKTSWNNKTPVSFDNMLDSYAEGTEPFVRMFVRMSTGGQETLGSKGNRVFRREGYLIFQSFTPSGTGTKVADEMSQEILDIFDGISVEGVLIRNGGVNYEGGDGKWYNQNVQFTILYDEIK